eukprot:5527309-Amphidinium_carterae.1
MAVLRLLAMAYGKSARPGPGSTWKGETGRQESFVCCCCFTKLCSWQEYHVQTNKKLERSEENWSKSNIEHPYPKKSQPIHISWFGIGRDCVGSTRGHTRKDSLEQDGPVDEKQEYGNIVPKKGGALLGRIMRRDAPSVQQCFVDTDADDAIKVDHPSPSSPPVRPSQTSASVRVSSKSRSTAGSYNSSPGTGPVLRRWTLARIKALSRDIIEHKY